MGSSLGTSPQKPKKEGLLAWYESLPREWVLHRGVPLPPPQEKNLQKPGFTPRCCVPRVIK